MTDQGTELDIVQPREEVEAAEVALPPAEAVDQIPATAGVQLHPGPRQYVLVAVVLVVITAFEVAASYLEGDVNANLIILFLGVAAAVKFFLVAAWYMHMKQDAPFFRRVFIVGLVGATIVYSIALATFAATVLQT
jgi:cytochrome c oxidase subunit 4